MKILARPGDVLAALFARTAMTTGRSTTNRADKYFAALAGLFYVGTVRRGEDAKAKDDVEKQDRTRRPHPNLLPEGEGTAARSWGVFAEEKGTAFLFFSLGEKN